MTVNSLAVFVRRSMFALCAVLMYSGAAQAADSLQVVLHLLDYVAVEYPQFVKDGTVTNAAEYAEQLEFSENARAQLEKLPDNPRRTELVAQSVVLVNAIKMKGDGSNVATSANALKRALIEAYGLDVTPRQIAPQAESAALFETQCAACHGASGRGDGPAAASLDPHPTNFHDASRQSRRSVYGLYGTISMGVEGTSMAPFSALTDAQRWGLAFYISNLLSDVAQRSAGESLWNAGKGRQTFRSVSNLVLATPQEATAQDGGDGAAILAYLRASPQILSGERPSPIDYCVEALAESVEAYRAGDAKRAYDLSVSAYLEGFELVEANLDSIDRSLRPRIEAAMLDFRNLLKTSAPVSEVEARHATIDQLLRDAKQRLSGGEVSAQAQFVSSLIIIVREGLEAILVLAGMAAYLRRTGRAEGIRWLHGGWIGALGLGILTWWIAAVLIEVSGAQREVTEGVTALLASAVLLYVGFWLHSKSAGQRWSAFIKSQVSGAIGQGTLWGLAAISFLAVYREVFETVLFYQALVAQGATAAVLSGFVVGCGILLALALLIIRFSAKLPLGLFFGVSSVLLALMAVVFAGQGIAALQAAGKLASNPVRFPAMPLLGIYPNAQGLVLQLLLIVFIFGAYFYTTRTAQKAA